MNKTQAVWLIAGGPMQLGLAARIKQMGYALILTDMDPHCAAHPHADAFVQTDTFDVDANLARIPELQARFDIRACLTAAADCHPTVAHLSRALGLPGVDPRISQVCRHKHLTRELLTAAGIPQPRCARVGSLDEARQALQTLGGRGVIKATDNSASRGFALLDSPAALTADVFAHAVESGSTGQALIEEVLVPRTDCIAELSVETLWSGGRMYWLNWVDRLFRGDLRFFPDIPADRYQDIGWGVEIGHINPAVHPAAVRDAVQAMIEQAGRALGMPEQKGTHILKADMMLTDRGPYIIELTPRLSGGWDSSATTPARGGDFAGGVLKLALGAALDLDLWTDHFEYRYPTTYASILTDITRGAQNCIGRRFAIGTAPDRTASLHAALSNLKESNYVV